MRIDIAALTDIGRHKKNNEDFFGVFREDVPEVKLFQEGAMMCVADGLGGHVGGEIASKLAVALLKETIKEPQPEATGDLEEYDKAVLQILREGIRRANEEVHRTNRELVRSTKPMGTTLLGVLLEKKKVYIVNVGDSRCYHLRENEIIAKTEDHSWVDEQVKLGLMSRAEAEQDHRRNIVTRSIGTHPEVEVDTYIWHVVQGDILMLCTDGLVNMVKDADIQAEFKKGGTAAEVAQRLVTLANENGGKDNTTVLIAHVNPSPFVRIVNLFRRHAKLVVWGVAALVYGAACFAAGYLVRMLTG